MLQITQGMNVIAWDHRRDLLAVGDGNRDSLYNISTFISRIKSKNHILNLPCRRNSGAEWLWWQRGLLRPRAGTRLRTKHLRMRNKVTARSPGHGAGSISRAAVGLWLWALLHGTFQDTWVDFLFLSYHITLAAAATASRCPEAQLLLVSFHGRLEQRENRPEKKLH